METQVLTQQLLQLQQQNEVLTHCWLKEQQQTETLRKRVRSLLKQLSLKEAELREIKLLQERSLCGGTG